MSRLKRTLSAAALVLVMALSLAPAARAAERVSPPASAAWEAVWTRLAAFLEVTGSRWLGARPAVEKIGMGIDPDGLQAPPPATNNQTPDIGSGIDPNG